MKQTLKYIGIAVVVLILFAAYINRSSIYPYFDLSWLTEKCFLCKFENRHHCNLCKSEHRQCPFCDNLQVDSKK